VPSSHRQSVTIPIDLARKIEREARKRYQTFSKTLVDYARIGFEADQKAKSAPRAEEKKADTL
jgi:hypothetical protein